ncbi:hypothetical protein ES705_48544 [subsurface metagenome]
MEQTSRYTKRGAQTNSQDNIPYLTYGVVCQKSFKIPLSNS